MANLLQVTSQAACQTSDIDKSWTLLGPLTALKIFTIRIHREQFSGQFSSEHCFCIQCVDQVAPPGQQKNAAVFRSCCPIFAHFLSWLTPSAAFVHSQQLKIEWCIKPRQFRFAGTLSFVLWWLLVQRQAVLSLCQALGGGGELPWLLGLIQGAIYSPKWSRASPPAEALSKTQCNILNPRRMEFTFQEGP